MSEKPKLRRKDSKEINVPTQEDVNFKLHMSEYTLQQKYEKCVELFEDRMKWYEAQKMGAKERDYSWDPMKKTMLKFKKFTMENARQLTRDFE